MSLNYKQNLAYNIIMSGYNTFLTGGGGVGKTFVLRKVINDIESKNKNVMVVAPTGIAALNLNGATIHNQFEAPLGVLTYNKNVYEPSDELVYTDVVIIDEISMCRLDLFDFISNKIMDANSRRKRLGFKPIQLVVSGDFFQLPPVIRQTEKYALDSFYKKDVEAGFAFNSKMWSLFDFKTIILTEVIRQNEKEFIESLNKLRTGEKAYINYIYNNSCKQEIESAITICGTNDEASKKNEYELSKINEKEIEYIASTQGEVEESDTIAEMNLRLKEGARVMTLVNDHSYNNGSFGTVVGLYDDTIVIQMDNGVTEYVREFTWDVYRYELEKNDTDRVKLVKKIVGHVTQFPVKLAYAITIHKSQGQTYDAANISPYSWDCGQLYVALSRVRSLDKLHFNYEPDMRYLVTSLNVIKFYNSLVIGTEEDIIQCNNEVNTQEKEKDDLDNDFDKLLAGFANIK
jgi:ATP-dependent exoDNAse (exonuclease V) alpha subunit